MSQELASERKCHLGDLLVECLAKANTATKADNTQKALFYLRKGENLLEAVATQGGYVDPDLILVTLQNTALAYQRLGMYEQCASYLAGCAFNAKHRTALNSGDLEYRKNTVQLHTVKMRKARYLARVNLQLCAVLSLVNKHEAALAKARLACKYSSICVQEAHRAAVEFGKKHRKSKGNEAFEMVVKRVPLLEFLTHKTSVKTMKRVTSGKHPKLDLRSVLGVQHYNDWVHLYSIRDLMTIEPLTLIDVKTAPVLTAELSKDFIFEKVVFT